MKRLSHLEQRHAVSLAAICIVIGLAAFPLLTGAGIVNTRGGGDSPFLLQRAHQFVTALQDGHFPVRWMRDANYGYGYPFFNFYAPLSIAIAAAFKLAGYSYALAIKLAQIAGFVTAGAAMYFLAFRWFRSHLGGLLSAVAYTVAPFHLVNIYVRGDSLAEFWAMAFYPLALLAVDCISSAETQRNRVNGVAWLGLSYAALILSHNISALIFSPFLALYAVLRCLPDGATRQLRQWLPAFGRRLLWPAAGILLGMALSAWFWLPALAEQHLAQLGPVTSGYFHYSNHFRGADLVQQSLAFNYDVAGGGAFRMGLAQALVVLLGALVLYFRRDIDGRRRSFIWLGLLISTMMITPMSSFLWDQLPLLSYTQFPWRFLSVQALAGSLAVAALAFPTGSAETVRDGWQRFLVAGGVVVLMLVSSLAALQPDMLPVTDGEVTPAALAHYEWFTGNIGSTVSAEYLPPAADPRPFSSGLISRGGLDVISLLGEASATELVRKTDAISWGLTVESAQATLRLPLLAWPGWRAAIDGQAIPITDAAGSGLVTVKVPQGEHLLELKLGRTPVRAAAEWISLLAVIALLGIAAWNRPTVDLRLAVGMALLLLAILLGGWLVRGNAAPDGPATWDFGQMAYLHHQPEGILFEDGSLMADYRLDATVEGVQLELDWANPPQSTVTVSLYSPAINRIQDVPLIASQQLPGGARNQQADLEIPPNIPAMHYLVRLEVAGSAALTPRGETRGPLYLEPVWLSPASLSLPEASELATVQVNGVEFDQKTMLLKLAWWIDRPLAGHYRVALRLVDSAGNPWSALDTQPGYGYKPTTTWEAGVWTNDWLALPLPAEIPPEPLALTAQLYLPADDAVLVRRNLGQLAWDGEAYVFAPYTPDYRLPLEMEAVVVQFGDFIELAGYQLEREDETLSLNLIWRSLGRVERDYRHFVHLVNVETGETASQHDAMPRQDTYPTSQWIPDEVVIDPAILSLVDVPPGQYRVAVGLYTLEGQVSARLPVVSDQGLTLPDQQFILPEIISIP